MKRNNMFPTFCITKMEIPPPPTPQIESVRQDSREQTDPGGHESLNQPQAFPQSLAEESYQGSVLHGSRPALPPSLGLDRVFSSPPC